MSAKVESFQVIELGGAIWLGMGDLRLSLKNL